MFNDMTPVVGIIIALNAVITYKGLEDRSFFNKYLFRVKSVLADKEYGRLIMSGFLHADWRHFAFNMITLFFFGPDLERAIGPLLFAVLYLVSLVGGDLLALLFHKNHGNYSAIGASGAVTGVLFASIALIGTGVQFFLIPIPIPGWLFGLGYVAYTIYGIKSSTDNIGHEAHLGGGIAGIIVGLMIVPQAIFINYFPILAIMVPSILFLILYAYKPSILMVENPFKRTPSNDRMDIDERYNLAKANRKRELNYLLDKINKSGMDSLTTSQKERLKELSK
jgi:membrane associated rhomboid family serine protease